jgi:4-alpha-glucanotransferase
VTDAALEALAVAAGVQVRWRDAAGVERTVGPDSLRAILAALGLAGAGLSDLAERRRALAWTGRVATAGARFALPPGPDRSARLIREDGGAEDVALDGDGEARFAHAPLTPGDHVLMLDGRAIPLAVAPPRAPTPLDLARGRRLWGATAQLYALRGARGAPFGDFTALAETAAALARRGAEALAISPTHALFAADPARCSPYSPSTRLFANVLFADPAALCPDLPPEGPGGALIDWAAAGQARLARWRVAFERFGREAGAHDRTALAAFRAAGGADLEGHARFEALHARLGGAGWRDWPAAYRDVRGDAVEAFAREAAGEVDFHVFLQWRADLGLAGAQAAARAGGMTLGLISDLAVGMDPNGSHAWSRPHDLLEGLNVGAPPDIFQPAGQDWGLANFSPEALRASAYAPFRATLRTALGHAGGVRIDHAMGLRRLWLTPSGAPPREGAYLAYPEADLLNLVALEAWKAGAVAIGEDLGTVPEGFRETTTARGLLGMKVLWFERAEDGGFIAPHHWSAAAMATSTTHDLPTLAGWWRGRDIDWQVALGRPGQPDATAARAERSRDRGRLWSALQAAAAAAGEAPRDDAPDRAVDAAVAFVAKTACEIALIPLEDLAGEVEQANLPGVVEGHPNWRRRLDAPTEALLRRPEVEARVEGLRAERPRR